MSRRILVLNLLLFFFCFYLGRQVKRDFRKFREEHSVVSIKPLEDMGDKQKQTPAAISAVPISVAAYAQVSSKNLFLESRDLQTQNEGQVVEAVPLMNPKPVLIGVAKVGDQMRAMVRRQQVQQGKRAIETLRVGDLFEGYKVTIISETRIEFAYTSSSGQVVNQAVSFFDQANRQAGQAPVRTTPVSTSQIIQVGSGGSMVSLTPTIPSTVPSVNPTAIPAGAAIPVPPGLRSGPAPGQTAPAGEARSSAPLRRNEFIDDQGRRVIRTPFGDVVRPAEPPKQ